MTAMRLATAMIDRGWLPDPVIRFGIRRLLAQRLETERRRSLANPAARHASWAARLRTEAIAPEPESAREQHYEVPAEFFRLVLGPRLKYSSACWPEGVDDLAAAEETMLELTAQRAQIEDGQRVLDLGCGWGSLSLYLAERFPACDIVALSNSQGQGEHIRHEAERRGLANVRHVAADVNHLALDERFDRVVSVEMFEHLRNYHQVLERIASWLDDGGKLFVHIFCHRELTYAFEVQGDHDWIARHFFTEGLMPAADLLPTFQDHLRLEDRWLLSGEHYRRTLEAWLVNLDRRRQDVLPVLAATYGAPHASTWLERWRVFFMACAELFGTRDGNEWQVAHYRFVRP